MNRLNRWLFLAVLMLSPATLIAQNHEIWTLWHQRTVAKIDAATGTWTQFGTGMIDPARPTDPAGLQWTTIALAPDNTIYLLRRQVGVAGEIFLYSLPADNIVVSGGVVTNVQLVGSTGFCDNLDGLTAGPDGNIYFSAYSAGRFVKGTGGQADQCVYNLPARNGLYRYVLSSNTVQYVGTFANNGGPGQKNSFYTDLAFDSLPLPLGGDLVGQGIDGNGNYRLYTIPRSLVLTGTNQTFPFAPFSSELLTQERRDGVAFDPTNGDLFLGFDGQGVYRVTRAGANPVLIGASNPDLGWDLANRVRGCSDARPLRTSCVPGKPNDYVFTFEITNHSGRPMSSISITDPLPATVAPHSQPLNPPLANNASTTITVTIHGAVPGQVICLNGVMFDQECPNCCKFHVCTTIPVCRCIQIYADRGPTCTGNATGSFAYSFELQNLSAQTVGAVFINGPTGVTITPDYLPITPPLASNGGIDTTFQTITISGAAPGTQICLDFTVLDADLHQCCTRRLCIEVPRCAELATTTQPTSDVQARQGEPPPGVTPP